MIAGLQFDMGVGELGVECLQRCLKKEFTGSVNGELADRVLGSHYLSQVL